jgi:hypothetical protein
MTDIEELMDDEYARALALEAGLDVDRLLQKGAAFEALLIHARDEAIAAMGQLIHMQFETLAQVRQKQWEVTRYHDFVRWVNAIIDNGQAAQAELSEEEGGRLQMMIRGELEEKDA